MRSLITITLSLLLYCGTFVSTQPTSGGLSESLSSMVLECDVSGKSGLCVPSALKDIVCTPLGFKAADAKACKPDNLCCYSTAERATTTTKAPAKPQGPSESGSAIVLLTAKPDPVTTTSRPGSIKIPASLSAFLPGPENGAPKSKVPAPPPQPLKTNVPPVKTCMVGEAQGICVKSDLVNSLCKSTGFLFTPKGCASGHHCCYNGNPSTSTDNIQAPKSKEPVKKTPAVSPFKSSGMSIDSPANMETCSPQAGHSGLCIRSDVATMVCSPLGFTIGDQLNCANGRICCHAPSGSHNGTAVSSTSSPFLNLPPSNPLQPATGLKARPCQVAPGLIGVCVPPNLISSCPLFGRKISAFGCPTKPFGSPEYCCYEDSVPSDASDKNSEEEGLLQPFISVPGAEQAPKIESFLCGRKGLTGIEPRALPQMSSFRTSRLLGAHQTQPAEYCWHATLFDENDKPFCNGALIHRQWIVTAAHCVKRVGPMKTTVKLGLWSLDSTMNVTKVQSFKVLEAFLHYNFDGVTLDNNVALLHLDDSADFTDFATCLACLPSQASYEGSICEVTGWSSKDGGAPGADAVLSKLELAVINHTKCDADLRKTGKLQKSFQINQDGTLCVQASEGEDTCRGDGGSGLTCMNKDGVYELAGLVSWGLQCGSGTPTVMTRVWLYNSWIQEIIRRYT